MNTHSRINGVVRGTTGSFTKTNGVFRDTISYSKVNGVWRILDEKSIDLKNTIGFKLIYTLNKNRIHHDIPYLKYNSNIPHVFDLTGETRGNMDLEMKGVIFEYKKNSPEEEGVLMYEGRLYAVLPNGDLFNVCQMLGNNNDKVREDEMKSEFGNIREVEKLDALDIKISGYVLFEDYGYYFAGWNNIFNTRPFIDDTIYPDKTLYRKRLDLNSYNILPMNERDEHFDSVASIGVARDMQTPIYNMSGSHGILDHTITSITLNGINKPYVIEIHE